MSRSLLWFLGVGAGAALTHVLVFRALQPHTWPELANALGFVVAFGVSFVGHRWLSFRGAATTVGQSLGRFAVTALLGFATNEAVFALLLRVGGWAPLSALLAAMVLAAGQTWVLSRRWAFRS